MTFFVGAILALAQIAGEAPPAPEADPRPNAEVAPAEPAGSSASAAGASDADVAPESNAAAPAPVEDALRGQPGIRKLDRKSRAKVMSAMAGFVILWLAIIVFIWLGARYTRRYMHGTLRSSFARPPVEEDDWARKKLVPEADEDA
jgi:hypothetical protein